MVYLLASDETPPLENAAGPAYWLGPDRIFWTPQRVWIPLPQDVDPLQIEVQYLYRTEGYARWYAAEDVTGWMVPGSAMLLELPEGRYYGFVVRHAGIVQLSLTENAEAKQEAGIVSQAWTPKGEWVLLGMLLVILVAFRRARQTGQSEMSRQG